MAQPPVTEQESAAAPLVEGRYDGVLRQLPPDAKTFLTAALDILAADAADGARLVKLLCEQNLPLTFFTDALEKAGGFLKFENSTIENGKMMPKPETIALPENISLGCLVVTLAHEIRHLEQVAEGVINLAQQGKIVSPADAVLYTYFIEADAQATATEISFRLKQLGKPEAWQHLMDSASDFTDIAKGYASSVIRDPESALNGVAKKMAFNKWFMAEWVLHYGAETLDNMLSEKTVKEMVGTGARVEGLDQSDLARLGKYLGNADENRYRDYQSISPKDMGRFDEAEKRHAKLQDEFNAAAATSFPRSMTRGIGIAEQPDDDYGRNSNPVQHHHPLDKSVTPISGISLVSSPLAEPAKPAKATPVSNKPFRPN